MRHAPVGRVAGDPGVTIADFNFTPGTITVHAGDTITWTNDGPSSHTATARDGSFDTGTLRKGASGSHTFTQAGSFSYLCKIHPFMHGTIVVLAAASTSTRKPGPTAAKSSQSKPGSTSPPAGSNRGSTAAATGEPAGSNRGSIAAPTAEPQSAGTSTLPMTGADVFRGLSAGLLLFGFGLVLRRGWFR